MSCERDGLKYGKFCHMTRQSCPSLELIVGFCSVSGLNMRLKWTRRCHGSPDQARVSLAELRPSSRFEQALPLTLPLLYLYYREQLSPRR